MKSLKSLILGSKAVPYIDVLSESTREGLNKAYIPKFLYKPPFGFPRFANIDYIRYLARTPYVEMAVDTILKEIASIEWDITVNPDIPERIGDELFYDSEGGLKPEIEAEINHIKSFLKNPNTNKESFEDIFIKMALRDVLEINTGVVNKVYNLKGEMVELVARDGATFTKNPDIHGMYTNRDEVLIPKRIVENPGEAVNPFQHIHSSLAREKAAYFQYGWISGPVPVPFGKSEIVWLQNMIRSDDIYGYSPVQLLANTLQMLLYHIESDLEYYNDNNVPKGVIGIDASDADEIRSFREQWHDSQRTKDEFGNWKKMQHKVPILNYIPKFERIEFSSEEIQMIEKQKWYSKMVWACFGVTGTELGYTEDSSGVSNQIVQSKVFKKKAINPNLRLLENHINREVVSEFEYTIDVPTATKTLPVPKYVFRFHTFDVDDEKSKADLYRVWVESGLKTINEIRMMEGDVPLDWGDNPPSSFGGGGFGGANPFDGYEDEALDTSEDMRTRGTNPMNDTFSRNESRVENAKSKNPLSSEDDLIRELEEHFSELEDEVVSVLEANVGPDILKDIKGIPLDLDSVLEVKALDDIVRKLMSLVEFDALREATFAVIKSEFLRGADDSEKDVNRFKPYNYVPDANAIEFISRFTFDNIKGMSEDIANGLRVQLQMGFMNGEGIRELKNRVLSVFEVNLPRARTIARTETARAHHFGKLNAYQQSGLEARKWILMTDDNRTSDVSKALNKKYGTPEQAIPLDENFKATVKVGKKTIVIDQPAGPFHPNERCELMIIPVLDED